MFILSFREKNSLIQDKSLRS